MIDFVGDELRAAEFSGIDIYFDLAMDQSFAQPPISKQVVDRDHRQVVFDRQFAELVAIRHAGMFLAENLDDRSGWLHSCHTKQIDRCFGMTGSPQSATIFGEQNVDMTRLDEFSMFCIWIGQCENRLRSVVGAHSRSGGNVIDRR